LPKSAIRRLPDAHLATIEQSKITAYLLASSHPVGRAKAIFFTRLGFDSTSWQVLRDALLEHARRARVLSISDSPFGTKYMLEGALTAADGRKPLVRSIWFIRRGETVPRFVTAYPGRGVRP
jgi:hypothetical protein